MTTTRPLSSRRLRLARSGAYPGGRVQLYIEPRGLWVGGYVGHDAVFVCVLTLVLRLATRRPAPAVDPPPAVDQAALDEAMWSVWMYGKWHWLTREMTTPAREAAVAAVLRHDRVFHDAQDPYGPRLTRESLAWWDEPETV